MSDEKTTPVTDEAKPAETAQKSEDAKASDSKENQGQNGRGDRNERGGGGGRRPRRNNNRKQREPKEFEEAILQIDRVTRVTKGGRQLRFRVSVVIGDQKGRVGFGIGKSSEVMMGVQKAIADAKKNLIKVPIFEDSIPHAIEMKYKATRVLLFPAPEGKGVIAGGAVRKVLELAGVKNVLSKMHGSRNKLNASYATINALKSLQNRAPHKKKGEEAETTEVEENKATEAKAPAKKTEAKKAVPSKAPKSDKVDDLTKIEGIGPKIAELINKAGMITFADLAKAKTEALQTILDEAGSRYKTHDPSTWVEQSKLAAADKWDELKKLQDELDGGKRA